MPARENFTERQYEVLRSVFSRFADLIERVDVYGSRARGTHRPGSDVDLLIHGTMDLREIWRVREALEESPLSIFADVKLAAELPEGRFRDIVLAEARPLFDRADLTASN